ncbi:hypothetical protein Syun_026837 [Stephania yunnanensis]|uniref:Helitron helicase-like domain-containing protein n=1 Tax=Stephania yunnanensis TaxID=152371 RepID=A0AAP0EEI3_9MAGN
MVRNLRVTNNSEDFVRKAKNTNRREVDSLKRKFVTEEEKEMKRARQRQLRSEKKELNDRGPRNAKPRYVAMGFDHVASSADVLPLVNSCRNCNAKKFFHESNSFYCSNGQVTLVPNVVPEEMFDLFTSNNEETREFLMYIRTYNTNFDFTSFGVKCEREYAKSNMGVYTFRVQGQIHHFINNLLPDKEHPSYLQLYFYDTDHEVQNRMHCSDRMKETILARLISILAKNPYASFFRTLQNKENLEDHVVQLVSSVSLDQRVFNMPTTSQVACYYLDR